MLNFSERIQNRIQRDIKRWRKHRKQNYHGQDQQILFICGVQRSGTNMLLKVFDNLPYTRTYNEDNPLAFTTKPMYNKMRIKRFKEIKKTL